MQALKINQQNPHPLKNKDIFQVNYIFLFKILGFALEGAKGGAF
ncbi:MAG: hypothetical protein R3Y46_05425 [Opitutales bacterium]